jgi:hypothetical protein
VSQHAYEREALSVFTQQKGKQGSSEWLLLTVSRFIVLS